MAFERAEANCSGRLKKRSRLLLRMRPQARIATNDPGERQRLLAQKQASQKEAGAIEEQIERVRRNHESGSCGFRERDGEADIALRDRASRRSLSRLPCATGKESGISKRSIGDRRRMAILRRRCRLRASTRTAGEDFECDVEAQTYSIHFLVLRRFIPCFFGCAATCRARLRHAGNFVTEKLIVFSSAEALARL